MESAQAGAELLSNLLLDESARVACLHGLQDMTKLSKSVSDGSGQAETEAAKVRKNALDALVRRLYRSFIIKDGCSLSRALLESCITLRSRTSTSRIRGLETCVATSNSSSRARRMRMLSARLTSRQDHSWSAFCKKRLLDSCGGFQSRELRHKKLRESLGFPAAGGHRLRRRQGGFERGHLHG